MAKIVVAQEQKDSFESSLFADVFQLRYEAFVNRLNWEVVADNGRERDCFDDLQPYHIAIKDDEGRVQGCWRALPTLGSYMLKDVFPVMLQGESVPRHRQVWEISRLVVRKGAAKPTHGCIGDISVDLVLSFRDFALKHGIRSYVTVTTLAGERLLKMLGVRLRRLGAGKVIQVGIEKTVALWIDVNDIPEIKKN
ncbi:acyl-homoserine-lactone synthase [Gynuella sunshinyii]|uniref:Acyl-homoserine-lactone synthase n=1 Tax=Gynuella sunshinyii YC6258 TaxID=1445510 RepID=A0A0C5VR20_9GAMM|nr:acyl-homoserine-lactone synthase [Gynuella sunshinyii]AJQ97077.1 N-acyl-L-homoserine lactone synthetase [Gynuella sunshinyii YC6258]